MAPGVMRIVAKVVVVGRDEPFAPQHLARNADIAKLPLAFTIACGDGKQTWKWLGTIACQQFCRMFHHHQSQFLPINIVNSERLALFPWQTIVERCTDKETVVVEVLGPGIQRDDQLVPRERSIWELFAYCDPSTYVSVRIVYTLPQGKAAPDGAVRLIGNFNGWATPVQMTKADGNDLATTIKVPPEALVIFRFVVGDQDVLSDRYQKVHDNEGKPRPSALSRGDPFVRGKHGMTRLSLAAATGATIISPRLTGSPRTPRRQKPGEKSELDNYEKLKQFDDDWKDVRLSDIIKGGTDQRTHLKIRVFQDYAAFQFLFKYVACTRADRIGYVKLEEAVGFAREAGLHHGRLTIDAVYDRASIEEDKVDDKPGAKADASKPVRDDRAPDRLLSRGEFMEVIVRASLREPGHDPTMEPGDKYAASAKGLMELAGKLVGDDLGPKVHDPSVMGELIRWSKTLKTVFQANASANGEGEPVMNGRQFLSAVGHVVANVPTKRVLQVHGVSKAAPFLKGNKDVEVTYDEFVESLGRLAALKFEQSQLLLSEKTRRMLGELLGQAR
ncbi:AMP-activated protein kinase glycogen-binding domain-containing protein [Plasmodiophora brassicae]